MTTSPPQDSGDERQKNVKLMVILGLVMLIVPLAGTAFNVGLYLWGSVEQIRWYFGGVGKIVVGLAIVNLLANWFHYRHTRMSMDIVSRILTYIWVLSFMLLFREVAF